MSEAAVANQTNVDTSERQERKGPKMGTGGWWIRATKEFGFPVVFGLIMLWLFSGLMGDYRDGVRSSTATNSKLAIAVESLKGDADDKTKAIESQTRALWELKRNSDENLTLNKELGTKLDRLGDSFDRVASGIRHAGAGSPPTTASAKSDRPDRPDRPDAPPMPTNSPQDDPQ